MAGSTINGNAGAAASGSLVYAQPIDSRGALIGAPQPAVVAANGSYSFTNLPAGTYNLDVVPGLPNPSTAAPPLIRTQAVTMGTITVDGSSTYAI